MSDLPTGAKERLAAITMPERIARLARDTRGYPIPKFVEYINGKPDFRIMRLDHMIAALKRKVCWICGGPLGVNMTFVIGPMCTVNRTSSEPPSHLDCAQYAAKVCPFLAIPEMRRIETNLPEGSVQAGIGITRNPGVVCLWIVRSYRTWQPTNQGILFEMGEPHSVEWYARGRKATRAEVLESINSGLPLLEKVAAKERGEIEALKKQYDTALNYIPSETE